MKDLTAIAVYKFQVNVTGFRQFMYENMVLLPHRNKLERKKSSAISAFKKEEESDSSRMIIKTKHTCRMRCDRMALQRI